MLSHGFTNSNLNNHITKVAELQYGLTRNILTPNSKKHVRFADDCGGKLEVIRIMKEPSDCPPTIDPSVILRFRKAAKAYAASSPNRPRILSIDIDDDELSVNKKQASWEVGFIQPASQYVKFRETLDINKVALENVMLRNHQCKMIGTIKVVNIAFEKHVFVRYSWDGWKSHLDQPASYQHSLSKTYDIFRFEIDLPINEGDVIKVEFCIGSIINGIEHWDSNDGHNYSLISKIHQPFTGNVRQSYIDMTHPYSFANFKLLASSMNSTCFEFP